MSNLIGYQKLHPDAHLAYAHVGDAGIDICAVEDVILFPGDVQAVSTGIALEIPDGWAVLVVPRSGLAAKHGVTVVNAPGLIDSGYKGEVKVILSTIAKHHYPIYKGDRIAQLVPIRTPVFDIAEVKDVGTSERGVGGLGSTGR